MMTNKNFKEKSMSIRLDKNTVERIDSLSDKLSLTTASIIRLAVAKLYEHEIERFEYE